MPHVHQPQTVDARLMSPCPACCPALHTALRDPRQFPEVYGMIRVRGGSLHFWDAPDDLRAADMDLVLEGGRMYLHGARGCFGSVPLQVHGPHCMCAYRIVCVACSVQSKSVAPQA